MVREPEGLTDELATTFRKSFLPNEWQGIRPVFDRNKQEIRTEIDKSCSNHPTESLLACPAGYAKRKAFSELLSESSNKGCAVGEKSFRRSRRLDRHSLH